MKTNWIERYLLLEETGELSGWQRLRLRRALQQHPELRARYEADRTMIQSYQASTPDVGKTSDFTLHMIQTEAKRTLQRKEQRHLHTLTQPRWSPAWAYATLSVAVLAVGIWLLNQYPTATQIAQNGLTNGAAPMGWTADPYEQVDELERAVMALQDTLDLLAFDAYHLVGDDEYDRLAMELMIWEDS